MKALTLNGLFFALALQLVGCSSQFQTVKLNASALSQSSVSSCIPNSQVICAIPHATAIQHCNSKGQLETCNVQVCFPGYDLKNNSCGLSVPTASPNPATSNSPSVSTPPVSSSPVSAAPSSDASTSTPPVLTTPVSTPPPAPQLVCSPNSTQSCAVGASIGTQSCNADGSVLNACGNFSSCVPGYEMKNQNCVLSQPLVADGQHLVVMQYETWFGPNGAQTFTDVAAMPTLTSSSMQAAGLAGYDSADPAIIAQHAKWLQAMQVDAVQIDLTNGGACTFNDDINTFCGGNADRKTGFLSIKNNFTNLYNAYSQMGIPLKIIPLMDGQDDDLFTLDTDGKTAFEKMMRKILDLSTYYRNQTVYFQGRPLVSIYLGTPARTDLLPKMQQILNDTQIGNVLTIRYVSGDLESQPSQWTNSKGVAGLRETNLWSWVDRLNFGAGFIPSYSRNGGAPESFTVTSATMGFDGWGNFATHQYANGVSLRGNGENLRLSFEYAKSVSPTFLIIDQFNEYKQQDQGWDANTTNDLEPTNLWGNGPMQLATQLIADYKAHLQSPGVAFVIPGFFQVPNNGAIYNSNGFASYCSFGSWDDYSRSGGAEDRSNVLTVSNVPTDMHYDGTCSVP